MICVRCEKLKLGRLCYAEDFFENSSLPPSMGTVCDSRLDIACPCPSLPMLSGPEPAIRSDSGSTSVHPPAPTEGRRKSRQDMIWIGWRAERIFNLSHPSLSFSPSYLPCLLSALIFFCMYLRSCKSVCIYLGKFVKTSVGKVELSVHHPCLMNRVADDERVMSVATAAAQLLLCLFCPECLQGSGRGRIIGSNCH